MKIKINSEEKRNEAIQELKNLDLKINYWFEIKKVTKKRSISINNLYWLWLTILEQSNIGYTKNEFHEIFLDMFASRKIIMERAVIIRSSKMNNKQMSDYMKKI